MHRCNSPQTNLRNQRFRWRKLFCNGKIDDRDDVVLVEFLRARILVVCFSDCGFLSHKRLLSDPGESVRRMLGATGSMIARVVLQLVALRLLWLAGHSR